jgi:hypothetical protein
MLPEPEELVLKHPVKVGGRESHDHYPTPRWVIDALWRHGERRGWWSNARSVLEPSCGEGGLLDFCRDKGLSTLGYELHQERGEEARRRGHLVELGDALARPWAHADLVIMNPPYGEEAARFVTRGIEWLREQKPGARLCVLLYISFLEPAGDRAAIYRVMPPDVLILHTRPKFDGQDTNRTASAWYCWPGTGQLRWLQEVKP